MSIFTKTLFNKECKVHIDEFAKRSETSIMLEFDGNVVLATICYQIPETIEQDFLPLTVAINDNLYSKQRIPGSFNRREGRPSLSGTLASRIIDRSIRPLFDKYFFGETQLIINPYNINENMDPTFICFLASSLALACSSVPFKKNVVGLRVVQENGEIKYNYLTNPEADTEVDMFVAFADGKFVMIDAEFSELTDEQVSEIIENSMPQLQEINTLIEEVASEFGKDKVDKSIYDFEERISKPFVDNKEDFIRILKNTPKTDLDKELQKRIKELEDPILAAVPEESKTQIKNELKLYKEDYFSELMSEYFRESGKRFDGRKETEIRALSGRTNLLENSHGSGYFTRGETEVLSIITFDSLTKGLLLDDIWNPKGEKQDFFLHYNFPPFSVGETYRLAPPKRRELGHGALAEKAIRKILVNESSLPYTIRVVCEVLASNGSSSQASICATSLALFDAGIDVTGHVAGHAIGLITKKSGEKIILNDIEGWEDHYGEMDFKVAETRKGICSIQLDLKNDGLEMWLVKDILKQAKKGNQVILDKLYEIKPEVNKSFKDDVLKFKMLELPKDKVGALIGPGGKTIKGLIDDYEGVDINVVETTAYVYHKNQNVIDEVIKIIKGIVGIYDIEFNVMINAPIVRIEDYGLFVDINGKWGLVHYKKLPQEVRNSVKKSYKIGDRIKVIPTEKDDKGRLVLEVFN